MIIMRITENCSRTTENHKNHLRIAQEPWESVRIAENQWESPRITMNCSRITKNCENYQEPWELLKNHENQQESPRIENHENHLRTRITKNHWKSLKTIRSYLFYGTQPNGTYAYKILLFILLIILMILIDSVNSDHFPYNV